LRPFKLNLVNFFFGQANYLKMAHVQAPVGKDKAVVNGSMLNSASGPQMKLHAHHNWSGLPFALFPDEFAKGDTGEFVHKGEKPTDIQGSKGVVVYAGTNQSGTPDTFDCAWLLAWSAPFPDSNEHNYKVCPHVCFVQPL